MYILCYITWKPVSRWQEMRDWSCVLAWQYKAGEEGPQIELIISSTCTLHTRINLQIISATHWNICPAYPHSAITAWARCPRKRGRSQNLARNHQKILDRSHRWQQGGGHQQRVQKVRQDPANLKWSHHTNNKIVICLKIWNDNEKCFLY